MEINSFVYNVSTLVLRLFEKFVYKSKYIILLHLLFEKNLDSARLGKKWRFLDLPSFYKPIIFYGTKTTLIIVSIAT